MQINLTHSVKFDNEQINIINDIRTVIGLLI